MKILEIETSRRLRREEAADLLRELADSLARHNDIEFTRDGVRYTIDVPREIELSVELEIDDDGTELEIELSW